MEARKSSENMEIVLPPSNDLSNTLFSSFRILVMTELKLKCYDCQRVNFMRSTTIWGSPERACQKKYTGQIWKAAPSICWKVLASLKLLADISADRKNTTLKIYQMFKVSTIKRKWLEITTQQKIEQWATSNLVLDTLHVEWHLFFLLL